LNVKPFVAAGIEEDRDELCFHVFLLSARG